MSEPSDAQVAHWQLCIQTRESHIVHLERQVDLLRARLAGAEKSNGGTGLDYDSVPPSLAEFLLARIAEDEAAARRSQRCTVCDDDHDGAWYSHGELMERLDGAQSDALHIRRHRPDRVLAECDAKRRIVHTMTHLLHSTEGMDAEFYGVLSDLAAPYADHPDYRDEWRP